MHLILLVFALIIFAPKLSVGATALENTSYSIAVPFLAQTNPSLLAAQSNAPCAVMGYYDLEKARLNTTAAATVALSNKGVSVLYNQTDGESAFRLTGAFAQKIDRFYAGAGVTGLIDKEYALSAVGSLSYEIIDSIHVSIGARNLMLTQTGPLIDYPYFSLAAGGRVPALKQAFFDIETGIAIFDPDPVSTGMEIKAAINKNFFFNPGINIGAGVKAEAEEGALTSICASPSAGVFFQGAGVSAALFASYTHDFKGLNNGASVVLYVNPVIVKKKNILSLDVSLNDSILNIGSDNGRKNLLITVRCTGEPDAIPVESWVIQIVSGVTENGTVLKVFAGGSTPPSTIAWDGYRDDGTISPLGTYLVQMVAVDRIGRRLISVVRKINIR